MVESWNIERMSGHEGDDDDNDDNYDDDDNDDNSDDNDNDNDEDGDNDQSKVWTYGGIVEYRAYEKNPLQC